MLPSNFEPLAAEAPDLAEALSRVGDWVRHHQTWTVIDPRLLSEELHEVDAFDLSRALSLLVHSGLYRRTFMVVTPSGVLADQPYSAIEDIPQEAFDRWNNPFDTAGADIVQVLTVGQAAAGGR